MMHGRFIEKQLDRSYRSRQIASWLPVEKPKTPSPLFYLGWHAIWLNEWLRQMF